MQSTTTFSGRYSFAFTFALVSSLLCVSACATTSANGVSKTPLTADEVRVFEHGVDFIATLGGLEGRWRDEWDQDLSIRVGSSDAIVVVSVKTVRTDTDPEQRVTHRLFASIDRVMAGDPRGKEIELAVREGAPGFMSVNDNLARIQEQPFVAYLKWYQEENGRVGAHFHLSPASSEVLSETEGVLAATRGGSKPSKGRVVVHNN